MQFQEVHPAMEDPVVAIVHRKREVEDLGCRFPVVKADRALLLELCRESAVVQKRRGRILEVDALGANLGIVGRDVAVAPDIGPIDGAKQPGILD